MRTTVYSRLFDRLADLIPTLRTAKAGAVFCAPPRNANDMAVYCHVAEVDGDMRLIELADDNITGGTVMPAPWLKLRVDMANKLAEVLEMEDTFGYQVIYTGGESGESAPTANQYVRCELAASHGEFRAVLSTRRRVGGRLIDQPRKDERS